MKGTFLESLGETLKNNVSEETPPVCVTECSGEETPEQSIEQTDSASVPNQSAAQEPADQLMALMQGLSKELGSLNALELISQMERLSKQSENYSGFLKEIQSVSSQTLKLLEGIHHVSKSIHDRDQVFVSRHNQIISSINNAEAAHKWTLDSFLALVEKKSAYIVGFNEKIGDFNKLVERTRRESTQLSDTFRSVNTELLNNKQYLENFRSSIEKKIIESSNKAVSSFYQKTKWLIIINVIFLFAMIVLLKTGV